MRQPSDSGMGAGGHGCGDEAGSTCARCGGASAGGGARERDARGARA